MSVSWIFKENELDDCNELDWNLLPYIYNNYTGLVNSYSDDEEGIMDGVVLLGNVWGCNLFCPIFSHGDFIKTTKRLAKDALLACKRCPFEVLLTPFWSPIKHLFLHSFTTYWFSVGYEGESKGSFGVILRVLVLCFCKENSNSVSGSNDVIKGWMRRKNTLFWGNIYFIVLFGQLLSNKNRNKKVGI